MSSMPYTFCAHHFNLFLCVYMFISVDMHIWGLEFHASDLPQSHSRLFLRWVLTWCPLIRLDRLEIKPQKFLWLWDMLIHLAFYVCTGVPNSGPYVCVASTLQTKPFPHPYAFNLCAKSSWDNYYYLHYLGRDQISSILPMFFQLVSWSVGRSKERLSRNMNPFESLC